MDTDDSLDSIRKIKLLLNNQEVDKEKLNNDTEKKLLKTFKKLQDVNSNLELYRVSIDLSNLQFDILKQTAKKMTGASVKQYKIDLPTTFEFDELNLSIQNDIEDITKAKNLNNFMNVLQDMIDNDEEDDTNFYKGVKSISKICILVIPNLIKSL